jgi:hypothetical protein
MNRSRTFWLALVVYGATTLARVGPTLPGSGTGFTWVTVVAAAAVLLGGVAGLSRDQSVQIVEERVLYVYLVVGAALLATAAFLASLLT